LGFASPASRAFGSAGAGYLASPARSQLASPSLRLAGKRAEGLAYASPASKPDGLGGLAYALLRKAASLMAAKPESYKSRLAYARLNF